MSFRLALNSWSFYLSLPWSGITGMFLHSWPGSCAITLLFQANPGVPLSLVVSDIIDCSRIIDPFPLICVSIAPFSFWYLLWNDQILGSSNFSSCASLAFVLFYRIRSFLCVHPVRYEICAAVVCLHQLFLEGNTHFIVWTRFSLIVGIFLLVYLEEFAILFPSGFAGFCATVTSIISTLVCFCSACSPNTWL